MKLLCRAFVFVLGLSLLIALPVSAGQLEGKWLIELGFGQWHQSTVESDVSIGSVSSRIGWTNMSYSFAAGHWLDEQLAVVYTATGLSNEIQVGAGIGGVSTADISVTSHYVGLRYYFPQSTFQGRWRPFLVGGVGPVIGSVNSILVNLRFVSERKTETVFGGLIGGGVDLLLSRRIKLGFLAAYNTFGDFKTSPLNAREYGGAEFLMNFGLLLGKHHD